MGRTKTYITLRPSAQQGGILTDFFESASVMHLYTKCNKISSLQTTNSTENPEMSESNPQGYQTVGITSQNNTKDLSPRNSQDIYQSSNKPIDWLKSQFKLSQKL